jgi:hypothetical protein
MEDNKENKSSSTSFKVFVVSIILIILYPPIDQYKMNYNNFGTRIKTESFDGWDFIWNLSNYGSGGYQINITYFIIEIVIVGIIYIAYNASKK